jgi:hypothetical protein
MKKQVKSLSKLLLNKTTLVQLDKKGALSIVGGNHANKSNPSRAAADSCDDKHTSISH